MEYLETSKIEGYECNYEISRGGQVKNTDSELILKHGLNDSGYPIVHLKKNGRSYSIRLHRLLAIAFIPNPNNLPHVNHLDGNKLNYALSNLAWSDNYDNNWHAWNVLKKTMGDPPKAVNIFDGNNLIYKAGCYAEAARFLGITKSSVQGLCYSKVGLSYATGYFVRFAGNDAQVEQRIKPYKKHIATV